ncbi:prolyl oligopeptidase family protein [Actinorugispora endophytica]|uniref:Prolyl oligopeptidase family protein n=2 Tax=Actinorugispora endophytica TaxID=1605990 RepID=A0A4R6V502_9ACTN|nr:prolyl oligopeptidase family protein [Actinorugispora endophytica]
MPPRTGTNPRIGAAAGVPYVALPPAGGAASAPLVVVWHMMDAPRSAEAMAAALPLAGLDAWRVFLDLPLHGARTPDDIETVMGDAVTDPLLKLYRPLIRDAAREFPAVLAALRERLDASDGPVGLVGGSAGGAVALTVLAEAEVPVAAAVLVNPVITARGLIAVGERAYGGRYEWTPAAEEAADQIDYVARAPEIAGLAVASRLLLISGEHDHAEFRDDAVRLRDALGAALVEVPGMAHPLAEEPGVSAAPQTPHARTVDAAAADWLGRHLTDGRP